MRTLGELFDKLKALEQAERDAMSARSDLWHSAYSRLNKGKQQHSAACEAKVKHLRAEPLPSTDHPGGGNGE